MMQVKRYVAPSYAEALIKAKNELGTEAIIVDTRKVKVGGFLGLFSRTVTELTVALDQPVLSKPAHAPAPTPTPTPAPPPVRAAVSDGLEREVAALRSAVTQLVERGPGGADAVKLRGYARRVYDELTARGVEEKAALAIGQQIRSHGEEGRNQARAEIARILGSAGAMEIRPGQRRVIALVGPTGVGKTTTIAKLAAYFALERGLNVGLVTSDTYRIAAVEQLRTYADIIGRPLYTVDTPDDVSLALKETSCCDVVLVDTGGRNHRDTERMQELRQILTMLSPDETHLVYSLTANPRDAYEAMEHYLPLGVNRLTFTKLDEAAAPGLILNLRMRCNQPLGYITYGQNVPDDIRPAERTDFTQILLGA